jgi:hypothetical protein
MSAERTERPKVGEGQSQDAAEPGSGAARAEPEPRKRHGDALQEGTGTRHGATEEQESDSGA